MKGRETPNRQTLELKNLIRTLEEEVRFYKGRFPTPFADELEELHKLCADLASWAVPGQGKLIDSDNRGNSEPISTDGLSTRDGRATLNDRRTVEWARRQLTQTSDKLRSRMDPDSRNEDARPQCWRRTEKHKRGKRIPIGSEFCPYCGGEQKAGAIQDPKEGT